MRDEIDPERKRVQHYQATSIIYTLETDRTIRDDRIIAQSPEGEPCLRPPLIAHQDGIGLLEIHHRVRLLPLREKRSKLPGLQKGNVQELLPR